MEAATGLAEPEPGFLEGVREITERDGCVLIFDEMITGMRWATGGAQAVYGVTPDLSTWGKALGNGFAISALAGRRELMEFGGLATASRARSCCPRPTDRRPPAWPRIWPSLTPIARTDVDRDDGPPGDASSRRR